MEIVPTTHNTASAEPVQETTGLQSRVEQTSSVAATSKADPVKEDFDVIVAEIIEQNPSTPEEAVNMARDMHGGVPMASSHEQMLAIGYTIQALDTMGDQAPEGLKETLTSAQVQIMAFDMFYADLLELTFFPSVENGGKSPFFEDEEKDTW